MEGKSSDALIDQPLAHYLTRLVLEGPAPVSLTDAAEAVLARARASAPYLYRTACPFCQSEAEVVAVVYRAQRPALVRVRCPREPEGQHVGLCGERQLLLLDQLESLWPRIADRENLWVPPLYRRGAGRGPGLPAPHTPRGILAAATLLSALNQTEDERVRGLLFLAMTSLLVELHPVGVRPPQRADGRLSVEYNLFDAFARHAARVKRSLVRLDRALAGRASAARLTLRTHPGLDLSEWPSEHGTLVSLDLAHLTGVSPLTLAALWADGLSARPDALAAEARFFPRRPPFTPNLEPLSADSLEVVASELARVAEGDGHLFLGCGGITEAGMVKLLVGLRRAGLEVRGPVDWFDLPGDDRPPAAAGRGPQAVILYARKPRRSRGSLLVYPGGGAPPPPFDEETGHLLARN